MGPHDAPSDPRVAHYLFAHRALPRAFLRNPPAIIGILGSNRGLEFLTGMWSVMDEALDPHERVRDTKISLRCYALRSEVFLAVVTMPPVARPRESYFVGCAARLEGAAFARAFTLDAASIPGDSDTTGILECDAAGGHTLLDPPCPPDATSFVNALEELLTAGRDEGSP